MPRYTEYDADGNLIREWFEPDPPDPVVELDGRVTDLEGRVTDLEGGAG